ncbi:MAG: isochorismatase family protein [Alphaproteobacteria bacterium]|nr:isochorismatase family protein [Alphaproteobacteria bacterium]
MKSKFWIVTGVALATFIAATAPASAQPTIIDQWSSIRIPPAPALKEVTVDPKTTALLLLDFLKQTCTWNPRCTATLPATKKFLAEARAHHMLVIYSYVSGGTMGDTLPEVVAKPGEPAIQSGPDKFLGTDLEKILKDHGIKTVIVAGTFSQGAVLHTGDEATLRGFKVVVPIDGVSAPNPFEELYVAYNFTAAPRVGGLSTLTRYSMIRF